MSVLVDPDKHYARYVSSKPKRAYSQQVLGEVKLLSVDLDAYGHPEAKPFGSSIYRIQKYPGDIDLLEEFYCCESPVETAKNFAKAFKKVVKKVISSRGHYYSEIKCGLDTRFEFPIGIMKNGKYDPSDNLLLDIKILNKHGLMPSKEVKIIEDLVNLNEPPLNGDAYDIINNIIRGHRVLRWNPKEILDGYKILPGNKKFLLEYGLTQNTLIKIDVLTQIDARYIEVTNAYFLSYGKLDNTYDFLHEDYYIGHDYGYSDKIYFINVNGAFNELKNEVEKLYYSNMFYNPFKAVKRMFAIGRMDEVKQKPLTKSVMKKLFPFISSNTSLLYQIKSEIETISLLMEITKSPPMVSINKQVNGMKNRLATILEIKDDLLLILFDLIDQFNLRSDKDLKLEILGKLKKMVKNKINFDTITYLNQVQLNPIPNLFLPDKPLYDRSIIRTPGSDPINPLKALGAGFNIGGCNCNCAGNDSSNENANSMLATRINEINNMIYDR